MVEIGLKLQKKSSTLKKKGQVMTINDLKCKLCYHQLKKCIEMLEMWKIQKVLFWKIALLIELQTINQANFR